MPARKLPPNDVIVKLYRKGWSCPEIAERFGVAPVTVNCLLTRIGEPRRSLKKALANAKKRGRTKVTRYWLGKKQSAEMVESRVSKIRGKRHWLWKGGKSRRKYRAVIKKTKCAKCGTKENLVIHHKDNDHYNNARKNLMVLCHSCHSSLHKTAYWKAYRKGLKYKKTNGPIGWKRNKSG